MYHFKVIILQIPDPKVLELSYVLRLGNCVLCESIFTCMCDCVVRAFFCTRSDWIRIIFKQIYLTHKLDSIRYTQDQTGPGPNGSEEILNNPRSSRNRASPFDAIQCPLGRWGCLTLLQGVQWSFSKPHLTRWLSEIIFWIEKVLNFLKNFITNLCKAKKNWHLRTLGH